MHKILKRFLASVLLACLPLVFSACGGGAGGGSETVEMSTISGTAIKGPIKGALIRVFKLNSDGTAGELLGSGTSDGTAAYAIQIPKAKAVPPLLVTVSGQDGAKYTSEKTGQDVDFTPAETFNAAIDTVDTTKKYTVSPLTEAAFQQLQKFLTDNPTSSADTRVISAANARVATLFNVTDILADPASDLSYTAALRVIDQMVETSKTKGATNTLQTMNLINQAFVDVNTLAYQGYVTELTTAATTVATNVPTVAAIVNSIVTTAVKPPIEPDWTDSIAPNVVSGLKAVASSETGSTGAVELTWSAATTAGKNAVIGYDVYRNGSKITSVTSLGYIDRPLVPATTYKYYVVAFDSAGNRSVASVEVSATTPAVQNLTISAGGQLAYNVTTAGVGTATPPVLQLGGLLAGVSTSDIAAPSIPSQLAAAITAINASNSSVKLGWSASTDNVGVTGYDVYRGATRIGTVSQLTFTDASVANGVAASYTVVAFDAGGNRSAVSSALVVTPIAPNLNVSVGGQLSSSVTDAGVGIAIPAVIAVAGQLVSDVSTRDVAVPSTPNNVAATATAVTGTISSVQLTWSASTDNVAVTGYDVYRGASKVGTTSQRTYTDAAVTSGFTYNYSVVAFDAAGNRSAGSTPLAVSPASPNLIINVGGQISSF